MLARLARTIGDRLALALALPPEAAERAAYALENVFLFLITLAAILIASAATGLLAPALAASLTGAVLRKFSGGAHFSDPWRCIIFSTTLALGAGLLGRISAPFLSGTPPPIVLCVLLIPGVAAVLLYAPADTPAKPIPASQGRVLKGLSLVCLILLSLGLAFIPMARDMLGAGIIGLAWQLLTITPAGYRLYHAIDGLGAKGGVTGA